MPRKTTIPFPENKFYVKRDLWGGDQIDTSSPYIENGNIYRDIDRHPVLLEITKSGLSQRLASLGFIPGHRLEDSRLLMEYIPWCIHTNAHCLRQSRDGLLKMLELTIYLNERGYTLRDLRYDQVALRYSDMPLLMDIGSIYKPVGRYKGVLFKEANLWAKRIGLNPKSTEIKGLLKEVENFYPKEPGTNWDSYDMSGKIREDIVEVPFIKKHIEQTNAQNVLDAGANKGRISKYFAARMNMPVLACDTAGRCVEDLYLWAQKHNTKITALKIDITVPPLLDGYDILKSDALIASSLTHHLYRAGHNFVEQEKIFSSVTKKVALIEYVDPMDKHVSRWGVHWNQQEFEDAFKGWKLLEKVKLEPENPHRTWYAYEVCGV